MTIRFDEAFRAYIRIVAAARDTVLSEAGPIVVVRDLLGRLRLAISHQTAHDLASLEAELQHAAGQFFAPGVLVREELLQPEAVFSAPDSYEVDGIEILERAVIGAEWSRDPLLNRDPRPPRATMYGIKGGVGRSTALCAWARHLASTGARVLVVDLDLESPGVSASMLSPDSTPELGIVDWLVEDGVGNSVDDVVRLMVSPSPLEIGTKGRVLVAPCAGASNESYLAKLSRAYIDLPMPTGTVRSFADRLAQMLDALEAEWKPSVVLIDSRAGLHDLAGIATTRLSAMTFLFAVESRQTWEGYKTLVREWARRPAIASEVRERLRVVAAQVPETGREQYMERLSLSAYDLFSENLYEEAGNDIGVFNFDIGATEAPHFPLPIYWSRAFQDWDPLSTEVTTDQVHAAFGRFLEAATDLVLDTEGNVGS